jgi:endogenous inhibitor of DNA gyrase (YacG/DUF329 family)
MCPICGRDAQPRSENSAFPFCSGKCKLVDLGRWLDGSYRVPGPPVEASDELLDDDPGTARKDRRDPEEDG